MTDIVGRTTDGLTVISGAFNLYDTHGVPLEFLQDWARARGYVFSMEHFIEDAMNAGWSYRKALAVAEESRL